MAEWLIQLQKKTELNILFSFIDWDINIAIENSESVSKHSKVCLELVNASSTTINNYSSRLLK